MYIKLLLRRLLFIYAGVLSFTFCSCNNQSEQINNVENDLSEISEDHDTKGRKQHTNKYMIYQRAREKIYMGYSNQTLCYSYRNSGANIV